MSDGDPGHGEPADALRRARAARQDVRRPDAVASVHALGRLTARERVHALIDPGSEVEYGAIAARAPDGTWVPEAGGVDFVATINGLPAVVSSTDYTDHGGGYGAGRLPRLFALANEHRWPLVLFVDGGGSRARHPRSGQGHLEISGAIGRFGLFDGMAELSGWVPTVAIVSGPAFAGHASLAGFSDCVIATAGSSVGMGGPPMVEAALGKRLTPHELAGVEMHARTGGIELLVADEPAAIAAARRYLDYQRDRAGGAAGTNAADIDSLVPDDGPYDMHEVVDALVDEGSTLELRGDFAPSLITTFARLGGRSVGVMASQPLAEDAVIDEAAATKAARFIDLCDSYEFPMLVLVDTPGCAAGFTDRRGATTTEAGIGRWHMRPIAAHQRRTVPLFSIQVRRGRGLGPAILCGFSSAGGVPGLCLAWPTVKTGIRDGFSTVRDANAFDDVVLPGETRERILRLLRHMPRQLNRAGKKHPIDAW